MIRVATPSDDAAIRAVAEAAWWPTYRGILSDAVIADALEAQYTPHSLAQQRAAGIQFWVSTHATGDVCGFVAAQYLPQFARTEIHKLYVHPQAQGGGFGAALVQAAAGAWPQSPSIGLLVNRNNTPAIRFYLRQGLRIVASENNRLLPTVWKQDYRLERALSSAPTTC